MRIVKNFFEAIHPDYEEFLAQDIKNDSYSLRLQNDYLNTNILPIFKNIDFVSTQIEIEKRDE